MILFVHDHDSWLREAHKLFPELPIVTSSCVKNRQKRDELKNFSHPPHRRKRKAEQSRKVGEHFGLNTFANFDFFLELLAAPSGAKYEAMRGLRLPRFSKEKVSMTQSKYIRKKANSKKYLFSSNVIIMIIHNEVVYFICVITGEWVGLRVIIFIAKNSFYSLCCSLLVGKVCVLVCDGWSEVINFSLRRRRRFISFTAATRV